ncbi:MAG TPA: helix-turn-helix domain-containing protein [Polyangia bacterium]|jgi:excisionase family DNA binding protein
MPKKIPAESALFVRLPANAAEKLHRAAEAMGLRKKDIVANLVSRHLGEATQAMGSYSFHAYDPPDPPEVMDPEQVGQFLQIEAGTVIEMAEAGKLPGRKLGKVWRFSRAALVAWLSGPETR